MKVVLFCGGFGTRLREYSETIPKPMVPIGPRPIMWHLMKYYAHFGHREFILCLGYRGDMVKQYFLEYDECMSNDFTLTGPGRKVELYNRDIDDWKITFVDTGLSSNIAQRLHLARPYLGEDEEFLANYSDGLSDLPLDDHVRQFREAGAVASFVGVKPSHSLSRVGIADDGRVEQIEYLSDSDVLINGGFFVFRKEIFDYMRDGEELVEEPFQRLIRERKLVANRYDGFWVAMDTFKDKKRLDDMFERGDMPWQVWNR